MAIEKDIPKDICKYESKLIGPFTTRQVVCSIPGVLLGVGAFFLLGQFGIAQDIKLIVATTLCIPFLLCGFVKLYDIPFEKFFLILLFTSFLAPKHRIYKTENNFEFINKPDIPINKKEKDKKEKMQAKYISKNKDLHPFK